MGLHRSSSQIFFSVAIVCGISLLYNGSAHCSRLPRATNEYPLRLQPELDNFDVSKYLQNERLMRLQFKCLIFDGPCDIVGRWAKPRAKEALLGRCLLCTKTQEKWLEEWHQVLVDKFPDMYRAAVAKYIENEGIEISEEEKKKIEAAFSDDKLSDYVGNISKIAPTLSSLNETETTTTAVKMNETEITTIVPDSNTNEN